MVREKINDEQEVDCRLKLKLARSLVENERKEVCLGYPFFFAEFTIQKCSFYLLKRINRSAILPIDFILHAHTQRDRYRYSNKQIDL